MLNIKFFQKSQTEPQRPRSRLSFAVEGAVYSQVEEEISLEMKRVIARVGKTKQYLISPSFVPLNKQEATALEEAKSQIINLLSANSDKTQCTFENARNIAISELTKKISFDRAKVLSLIPAYDTIGYGPLGILLDDKANIEEIEINSPTSPIYIYHSRYGRCVTNLRFENEESFRNTLNRFIYDSEKELNDSTPIIDLQIGDSRVHAQLKPYSSSGACATIRIGGRKEANIKTLTENHILGFETLAFLWLALENKSNIVISGAPASGKTTLLTCIISLIPTSRRIISVEEDVNELKFYSNVGSVVSLYGSKQKSFNTKDQVINALRMRPEMLIVGEVRGEEARDLFSGANLGIPFLTTMHSNDGGISIIKRLFVRPMSVEPQAISALDLSIQMGSSGIEGRGVSEINEYCWLSRAEILGEGTRIGDDMVKVNPVLLNGTIKTKELQGSKIISLFSEKNGISKTEAILELKNRALFLKQVCNTANSTLEIIEKISGYGL